MSEFKTYREYRKYLEEGVNALPIFWAFSDKQFEDAMNQRGLTINDTDKIYRLGSTGGFYLKVDADKVRAWYDTDHTKILHDRMEKSKAFAKEAFEYEMANHEYAINWEGDYDVCSIFGKCKFDECKSGPDYLKDMGYSDKVINIYLAAANKICKNSNY